MNQQKLNRLLFLVCLILFSKSSTAQKMISSFTVGDKSKSYSKIMVIVKAKNASYRADAESDISERLQEKDIYAEPSYVRLPNELLQTKGDDEKAIDEFVAILRKNDFDGILVTSLVNSSQSVEFNPGEMNNTSYARVGDYYGTVRLAAIEPGSLSKQTDFIFESLLYDLRESSKENSLHWIGKISVKDPSNFEKASDKYAKKVVKTLIKDVID